MLVVMLFHRLNWNRRGAGQQRREGRSHDDAPDILDSNFTGWAHLSIEPLGIVQVHWIAADEGIPIPTARITRPTTRHIRIRTRKPPQPTGVTPVHGIIQPVRRMNEPSPSRQMWITERLAVLSSETHGGDDTASCRNTMHTTTQGRQTGRDPIHFHHLRQYLGSLEVRT